ncbi:MAG: GxxExxY protein, partial [Gemmatimonadetes bacterium]|nr:GxxExxY protein [Gemmatimonadota bacterium]
MPDDVNEVTREVVDAAIMVHRELGPGLLERAYRVCLAQELAARGLRAAAEVEVPLVYRGVVVEAAFRDDPRYNVTVLPVEAYLPRAKDAPAEDAPAEHAGATDAAVGPARISREELYHDVADALRSPRIFLALTLLSAFVAAVGLYRDDVAVIVGAMVIAPLLGPSVALALAVVLADGHLAARALRLT